MRKYKDDKILGRLDDPFIMADGTRVKTAEDWKKRRREIIDTAIELQFGGMPPKPSRLTVEPLQHGGLLRSYRITVFENTGSFNFTMQIFLPAGIDDTKKHPVLLTGDGCYRYCNDKVIDSAHARGWIVAKFNRVELAHDMYNESRDSGLYPLYPDMHFSALSAWAWGYSLCIDALTEIPFADETQVAITGHSRGGKAVLLAGAYDERIAFVNPNNSGTHGCGCWRYRQAGTTDGEFDRTEVLSDMMHLVPNWFGPEMKKYVGHDEDMPHDSHFLKALVAPRCFIETEALGDTWANPRGSYQTFLAAKEIYKLLGAEERIAARYREGTHAHLPSDFDAFLEFCDRMRRGEPLTEEYTRDPFPGMEPIFDWQAP